MCSNCDSIRAAEFKHEAEANCQPSSTNASPTIPWVHPNIFDSLPSPDNDLTWVPPEPPDDPNYQLLVDTRDVMSPGRMDKLMREFFEHLMEKCQRKNKAYAETDATSDALNNFREAAADFGISKLTYAMILQGKHYRAWKTFVRTGEAPDKAFRILGDIIVYAMLMYCIGVDEGKWKHEQEVMEDDD